MTERVELTIAGKEALEAELTELVEVKRPAVIDRIAQAKSFGDLSENSEYDDAKNEQGFIESRIAEIERILDGAIIVKPSNNVKTVRIGTTVKYTNTKTRKQSTYDIVASANANPLNGMMSVDAPIGSALLGKKEGEMVEITAPSGVVKVKITSIKPTK
ncbi:MAG: transcription elongation factor GreA [Coriobacteriia bacterium]|nr:transcription elongation factor GreA [Coriobacteriia bacterium]